MNPSDVIEQRYRLERLLGTGGMSEVWLAEDSRLGRWVAVKILRDSVASREDQLVDTLIQEARVVARLQHPNIVGVYDYGTHDGHHYLVMEYVHGYSVRQLLQTQGRLSEADALKYGSEIAGALQYAHDQGVIHCDVKPENILVNEQKVAKVTDFGVAETVSRTLAPEEMRDVLGTVAYLAPEVIQGAPADPRADVYSLGLSVYEMVAGRLPFTGASPAVLAGQRLGAPAPPLRTFAMSASPELEAVLARALAISQQDRYQTAGEFGAALRNVPVRRAPAAAVAPTVRPPVSPPRHTARVRRQPPPPPQSGWNSAGIVAVVAAIVFALGLGVVAAVLLSRDNENGGGTKTPTPTATVSPTPSTAPATSTPTPEPSATATPTPTTRPATATPPATATRTPTTQATTPAATATTPAASATSAQQPLLPGLPTLPAVQGSRR
ncbi:MAG TPA: serine/threonine-protein kinase [Tepidiformaceae bacterium]|nr:serine/threonine-protein kinase [Tepidiformaceae bacterium]